MYLLFSLQFVQDNISQSFLISCWPTAKLLIITSEGASGDYPGCTDLAYTKAAMDGADVLDCPVQMSKDGIPFCLGSINLIDKTTVAQSPFGNIGSAVPELNVTNGIFTFNLTWDEIKSLKRKWTNFHFVYYYFFLDNRGVRAGLRAHQPA